MDEHKYEESPETRAKKSQIAEERPRDSEGHFIHEDPTAPEHHNNKIIELLQENVHYSKKQDDLLDLHVGNPLRKITQLLEDIKKQKAFSFSIKGSLGIMGVAIVAGTFGILGVNNVLCDKGVQTKRGVVETLAYKENTASSILDLIPFADAFLPKKTVGRMVLLTPDNQIIHVVLKNNVLLPAVLAPSTRGEQITINPLSFFLTGNYDSCSQKMTITEANGVQLYSQSP